MVYCLREIKTVYCDVTCERECYPGSSQSPPFSRLVTVSISISALKPQG